MCMKRIIKFGFLGYNRRFRMFGFFRDKILSIGNHSISVKVHVLESFGCPFSSCNFDGSCIDCPNKICSQVTY